MAINDFIISTLNISDDMIFSIDTHKSSDKLHILIKLNDTMILTLPVPVVEVIQK